MNYYTVVGDDEIDDRPEHFMRLNPDEGDSETIVAVPPEVETEPPEQPD